eukprot:2019569-Pleurochrysis_carterae.AAC.4
MGMCHRPRGLCGWRGACVDGRGACVELEIPWERARSAIRVGRFSFSVDGCSLLVVRRVWSAACGCGLAMSFMHGHMLTGLAVAVGMGEGAGLVVVRVWFGYGCGGLHLGVCVCESVRAYVRMCAHARGWGLKGIERTGRGNGYVNCRRLRHPSPGMSFRPLLRFSGDSPRFPEL